MVAPYLITLMIKLSKSQIKRNPKPQSPFNCMFSAAEFSHHVVFLLLFGDLDLLIPMLMKQVRMLSAVPMCHPETYFRLSWCAVLKNVHF